MGIENNITGRSATESQDQWKHVADDLLRRILDPSTHKNASVHIGDLNCTRNKLETMISKGPEAFEVVSDFDFTMSKYRHNGVENPSCHGIFQMDPELTDTARNKLRNLAEKYFPIEFDPHMPATEKIPHLITWFSLTHEIMVQCRLHRSALAKTVQQCNLVLREGVKEFMELLHRNGIPALIFSAGLGDVIHLLLQRFSMSTDNVRVVSNFMRFNNEGILVGFEEPIIHTFNKTAKSIPKTGNGDLRSSARSCVLLLGDSTGDVHMADGATIDDPQGVRGTVLRIGFLNDQVEKKLEMYKSIYDIVLVNEDTFSVPMAVVRSVLQLDKPCRTIMESNHTTERNHC